MPYNIRSIDNTSLSSFFIILALSATSSEYDKHEFARSQVLNARH